MRWTLTDVFISVSLGALAGAIAVYALAFPPFVITILLVYLIYNLTIFLVPWWLLNRQLRESKWRLRQEIMTELRDFSRTPTLSKHSIEVGWNELVHVESLPEKVIPRIPLSVFVALYLLPILGIIPAYGK